MDDKRIAIYDSYTYSLKFSFNAANTPTVVKFNTLNTFLLVGQKNNNMQIVNLATNAVNNFNTGQT
jgi:hypothetical protein